MKSLGVLILVQPCFTRIRQEIGNKKKQKTWYLCLYFSIVWAYGKNLPKEAEEERKLGTEFK